MIKLNLLPEKVRSAERMRLVVLLGAIVYAVGMLALGWSWMAARAKVAEVQVQIDSVTAQLNAPELREAVQAVERFTKDEKEKNDKASVVNSLRKRQVVLLRMLDAVPDWMMNGQVWVDRLEVLMEKGERKVNLDGQAVSPLVFASFYTNLESQPLVKKMSLVSAPSSTTERGKAVVRFKVSFTLEELP